MILFNLSLVHQIEPTAGLWQDSFFLKKAEGASVWGSVD